MHEYDCCLPKRAEARAAAVSLSLLLLLPSLFDILIFPLFVGGCDEEEVAAVGGAVSEAGPEVALGPTDRRLFFTTEVA